MASSSLDRFRSIPLFADLDESSLASVAEIANEFEAPTGHVLVERGFPGSGMFVLEEGRVAVELPDGRRIELGPGQFFGEMSLLTDKGRTARVHALTEVTCLAIARDDFLKLIEDEPRIAAKILPVFASRLAELSRSEEG